MAHLTSALLTRSGALALLPDQLGMVGVLDIEKEVTGLEPPRAQGGIRRAPWAQHLHAHVELSTRKERHELDGLSPSTLGLVSDEPQARGGGNVPLHFCRVAA